MAKLYAINCSLRAVAFICITIAAMYFKEIGILWWYLLPAFMSLSKEEKE